MAEFIELRENDGEKVLVNIEHVIRVCPDEKGCYIYFDFATINGDYSHPHVMHLADKYEEVKRKIQQ